MTAWLAAFALTSILEVPIYMRALLTPDAGREPALASWPAALGVGFGASAITHPVVWFVMPALIPGSYPLMVLVAECFAIGVEAVWLRAFGLRRPLAWAAFANAASVTAGFVLDRIFG